jgi:hypothetical protein
MNYQSQSDSFLFYQHALNANQVSEFKFYGSEFISVIIYPFVKLGFSYFALSFAFSTVSLLAFLKYFKFLFEKLKIKNKKFLSIIILLFLTPSLHFWTSGLSKEALVFYLMCEVLFEVYKNKSISNKLILLSIAILLIRPYLFFILNGALFIHFLINSKTSKSNKLKFIFISILIFGITMPILMKFLGLNSLSLDSIEYGFNLLVQYSSNAGSSSIDILNSSYLEKLFLVLYRPLFLDARTIYQYIISMENAIFLILTIKLTIDVFRYLKLIKCFRNASFLIIAIVGLILFYSIYMYNLGLASRMRVMFLPYIYILIFMFYYRKGELFKHN